MIYGSLPVVGSVPFYPPVVGPHRKENKTRETDTDTDSPRPRHQSDSHTWEQEEDRNSRKLTLQL